MTFAISSMKTEVANLLYVGLELAQLHYLSHDSSCISNQCSLLHTKHEIITVMGQVMQLS